MGKPKPFNDAKKAGRITSGSMKGPKTIADLFNNRFGSGPMEQDQRKIYNAKKKK